MKRLLSLLTILLLITPGVEAATPTSYDVHNNPQMFLSRTITSTQVTNIQLQALKRNGQTVTFPTTEGGILRLRQGSKVEDIYYATGAVNATTKIVTLYGVIRDVCFNMARTIQTCSEGQQFNRGAMVELNVAAQLLNLKVNLDRANVLTASGALRFSGSGSLGIPTFSTESERNRQMGSTFSAVRTACTTDTGTCAYYIGGAWIKFGSGSTVNANLTTAGKVQIASSGASFLRTAIGSTGAENVLSARYTASGSGVQKSGYVPVLSGSTLTETLLGTGTSSGNYLRGNNYGNPVWTPVRSSTSLVNSGSLKVNSFATGSLVNIQQSSTSYFQIKGAQHNGHVVFGGTTPTIGGCAGGSIVGNDSVGKITPGGSASTTCALYFNKLASNPICTYSTSKSGLTPALNYTSSGVIFSTSTLDFGGSTISYHCLRY